MAPFELRWGIIATGGISTQFTKDLVLDPAGRDANDVKHIVKAVGSRSKESADKFISAVLPSDLQEGAQGGTYEEVFANPEVDVVYIGTPHTYHYENTMDALNAGKHVLCEKPFTFDVEELDELTALAKKKNLFLMEAVWTRFHPIAYAVQDAIFSGKYGKVKRVFADLAFNIEPDKLDAKTNRMIAAELGGGGLLDLGPYPMVWVMMILHQNPGNKERAPPSSVKGHMRIYERTGVDASSTWIVDWKDVGTAVCTTSIETQMNLERCVTVQMEGGELTVDFPTFRPEGYTITPKPANREDADPEGEGNANPDANKTQHHSHPVPESAGRGMNYQADEVARCIRDGKLESERCNLAESRIVQSVFDEVRKQGGYLGGNAKGKAGTR
ncbi:hypothetical protein FFLO_00305 [Filobasidium floriforme]|uniref:D-xylose 1-dehydrogenase (NADP(+), D-xylono-1,5-lactone-forming) n=1 Tax=Filobasidium floriforme TaxID=5210 RepID=A0A8K0JTK2_9TREE|nr:uncharacterized protein HD553DRAFT_297692 [Filobasidium floriforme]KAG7575486.1 hypothetical protein FFLO_00305 [Filobasidium floriforme]KAH8082624.1 hypothetical protein HD553DRAFT_297692 [Filobasidium floriforme]